MDIEDKNSQSILDNMDVTKIKNNVYIFLKRLFDIIFSLIVISILIVPLIIIAIIIWIDDPGGSLIFKQIRIGKDEKPFQMYKFRSMYSNAEEKLEELLQFNEIEGAMFKMKEDPRITNIGKFIREYSIDELPQLFNVLIGNMSLVGPRPPLAREVKEYTTYDRRRLTVKPGITGLWQVSGRNSLSFKEMVSLDLHYIQTMSTIQDIKILFKTVRVVIIRDSAY